MKWLPLLFAIFFVSLFSIPVYAYRCGYRRSDVIVTSTSLTCGYHEFQYNFSPDYWDVDAVTSIAVSAGSCNITGYTRDYARYGCYYWDESNCNNPNFGSVVPVTWIYVSVNQEPCGSVYENCKTCSGDASYLCSEGMLSFVENCTLAGRYCIDGQCTFPKPVAPVPQKDLLYQVINIIRGWICSNLNMLC